VAPRRLSPPIVLGATALALVAAFAVAAVVDRGRDSSATEQSSSDEVELAPTSGEVPASVAEVRLGALDGGTERSLGELLGTTPVVVNFFASWCTPCIQEMPGFERVHQDLGGQVAVIGMAYRDAPEDALATVARTGVSYPTFTDVDDGALTYFGGIEMPTTVFIDATGKVLDVSNGALTEDELRAKITDLFGISA
jgi:cytochrome c biogenesis protein CcmG/thiol:disulfide interchange protein DsbE